MRDFFVFMMITKTRPWRHIYDNIGIPRPKNRDIEIQGLKHHDIEKRSPLSQLEFMSYTKLRLR